jgi:transmembrane sensor
LATEAKPVNTQAAWHKVRARTIAASQTTSTPEKAAKVVEITRPTDWGWYRIAAAVTVFLVAGALFYRALQNTGSQEINYVATLAADTVMLSDGSMAILDSGASLRYPKDFGSTSREVALTGRAFFDIVPNKNSPFRIAAGGALVEVTGTSFQVDAWDAEKVVVEVKTGSVALSAKNTTAAGQKAALKAGEKGTLDASSGQVTHDSTFSPNVFAWQTGALSFENTPLQQVLDDLSQAYRVDLAVEGDVPSNCLFTAKFTRQPIEVVLASLQLSLNLDIRPSETGGWVVVGGCGSQD